MTLTDNIKKEVVLIGRDPAHKDQAHKIRVIFYKDGSIAFSEEGGESFISLYREQKKALGRLLR